MKIVNGTFYNQNTHDKVIEVLENARTKRIRIQVDYGNENGSSWGEIHDITGYVGRSTGIKKIPLLIYNRRSLGGGALLSDCIVKIVTTKNKIVLYEHPTYKPFVIE